MNYITLPIWAGGDRRFKIYLKQRVGDELVPLPTTGAEFVFTVSGIDALDKSTEVADSGLEVFDEAGGVLMLTITHDESRLFAKGKTPFEIERRITDLDWETPAVVGSFDVTVWVNKDA